MKVKIIIFVIFLIYLIFNLYLFINPSFKIDENNEEYINVFLDNANYQLLNGSTFKDLLESNNLDINDTYNISLDYVLRNNEYIYLTDNKEKKISINFASIDELINLPGIGEKTAKKIIEYRELYGNFKHIEELKIVNGIGDKKYEKIKELISI